MKKPTPVPWLGYNIKNKYSSQKFKHKILADNSTELENLWKWSKQFDDPLVWLNVHCRHYYRWRVIADELERLEGKMTLQGRFAFDTKPKLIHFKMVWG